MATALQSSRNAHSPSLLVSSRCFEACSRGSIGKSLPLPPRTVTAAKLVVPSKPHRSSISITKRGLAAVLLTTTTLSGFNHIANAAILEADDDVELLEKVKRDRKKRLERQEVINSSNKEAAYVQEVVYKLSKVGQAIDNNDLSAASLVLGPSTDAEWVKKGNAAFTKLTMNSEEKTEVDTFNSSLASLVISVGENDITSSKIAFVSSANALEKWAAMTGLAALLKGL